MPPPIPTPTPTPIPASAPSPSTPPASATSAPNPNQFIDQVYPDELAAIARRRESLSAKYCYKLPAAEPNVEGSRPHVGRNLSGLAFSGGGIRSACFNLGVIQALAKADKLAYFDYLSTVSGGGYIGATLSLMLRDPTRRPDADGLPLHFDSKHQRQTELGERIYSEPPALQHLRNQARYLDARGAFDYALIASLLARNALINAAGQSILLFLIALLGSLISFALEKLHLYNPEEHSLWIFGGPIVPVCAAALWVLVLIILRTDTRAGLAGVSRWRRERFRVQITLLSLVCVGVVLAWMAPWAVWHTRQLAQYLLGDSSLSLAGVAAAGGAIYELAKVVGNTPSALRRTLSAAVLVVIGPVIVWCLFASIAGWVWFGPLRSAGHFEFTVRMYDWLGGFTPQSVPLTEDGTLTRAGRVVAACLCCAFLIGAFWFDSNVNRTSMHGFYRDRLSRLFFFLVDGAGAVIKWRSRPGSSPSPTPSPSPDSLRLSNLPVNGGTAPYHLVNTALNIQKATDENRLRGRQADFFFFSPLWSGSRSTGYCKTADLEAADPTLSFASCVAISGAAASSYMGTQTNRLAAFSLALFNVRLGYWLPNPSHTAAWASAAWLSPKRLWRTIQGTAPWLFLKELTGQLCANDRFVNVSDGGHIENLATIELLRRRCRWIVTCDAEADPSFEFPSLAKLVRMARTDLGIDIDIDVSLIQKGNDKNARHFTVGTISYPGDPPGQPSGRLFYIKSSLAGLDETLYLKQQPLFDKDFPHTSTSDQFFDEQKFEAYRALGHHAAGRLLDYLHTNPSPTLTPWP